jgi:hypothetical protein
VRLTRSLVALTALAWLGGGTAARAEGAKKPKAAATAKKKKAPPKPAADDDDGDDASDDAAAKKDTSETARATKRYGAGLLYTPLSDYVLKYGASGFYQGGEGRWQAGLAVLSGSEAFSEKQEGEGLAVVGDAKITGLAVYGFGRFFFGNSFNAAAGFGLRKAEITYRIGEKTTSAFVDGKSTVQSLVVPVAIGNQWTWSNGVSLGVDWLVAFVPVTGTAKSETTGNLSDQDTQETTDEFQAISEKLSKRTSFTLALTSLAYEF